MTLPYVPFVNVAQVDMIYGLGENTSENVFNVLGGAPWTITTLTNLISAFAGWEADVGSLLRSHQFGLEKIVATDLTTQTSSSVVSTAGLPINGQVIANAYPENVTFAVKANTNLRGRSYRGRTYWIGLWEDIIVVDQISPTTAANIVAALNNLLTLMTPVNAGQMVVASRQNNGVRRTTGVATPITHYSYVDLTSDSQRRRLPGHNRHR